MSLLNLALKPVGIRKDGRPIYPIKGGSDQAVETPIPVSDSNPPTPSRTFTKEDIERARQQEKDKLYSAQEELKKQIADLTTNLQTLQSESEQRRQAAEEEARQQREAEQAKHRTESNAKDYADEVKQTLEEQLAQLKAEREQERAIAEKERQLFALQQYIQRRVTEESDNIAPELVKFVTGNNEQEVEASINNVKAATQEIVENFQATVTAPSAPRGVPVTGYTAAGGPFDTSGGQSTTLSPEDIRNMGMAEFAELRKKIGLGQSGQGQGMFG